MPNHAKSSAIRNIAAEPSARNRRRRSRSVPASAKAQNSAAEFWIAGDRGGNARDGDGVLQRQRRGPRSEAGHPDHIAPRAARASPSHRHRRRRATTVNACACIADRRRARRINSCLTPGAVMHEGDSVTTIEGLGTPQQCIRCRPPSSSTMAFSAVLHTRTDLLGGGACSTRSRPGIPRSRHRRSECRAAVDERRAARAHERQHLPLRRPILNIAEAITEVAGGPHVKSFT